MGVGGDVSAGWGWCVMPWTTFVMTDGTLMQTTMHPKHILPYMCVGCTPVLRDTEFQCDWPLENGKTCDAWLCRSHAYVVGDDVHLCPAHFEAWKMQGQPEIVSGT